MSVRLRNHLLYRLHHVARLEAVENAIENGILAIPGDEPSPGGKDSTRRIRRPAVEDDDDRFRRTFASDPREERQGRIVLGPVIRGKPYHEVARILVRHGIVLPSAVLPSVCSVSSRADGGDGSGADRPSVAEVWQAVRRHALPPQADETAVMLLLVAAIERAGLADGDWRRVLRRDWTATILSAVDGFELRIVRMLREGAFGHAIGVYDGYEMRGDMTSLPSRYERWRSLIVFRGKEEDSHAAFEREQQMGFAARLGVPVLGIADDPDHLPLRLRQAASLRLETGPLTSAIVGSVLLEVLGALPDDAAATLTDDICAALSLHDLAAAVRPGRNADEVVATLLRLAGVGDGHGPTAARGRATIPASGDRSGSDWGKGRNGRTVSSGSEIIKPAAPAIADPSADPQHASQQHAFPGQPPAPTVETLHGYGAARQWALDLNQDLALWRNGSLPWSQMSTKLLLSGPPGTGKTTFAKALCNTLQVPLLATSVSTWLEPSHLGDVIKRMRISFEEARKHAPAILFVDEIDGIGKRGRNDEYDDYWNSVVNKLLELLDGSTKSEGLIIVGATNHPDVIDPALLRSGRLETRIEIPLPDVDALVGILAHHLGHDCPRVIATRPESTAMDTKSQSDKHITQTGEAANAGL